MKIGQPLFTISVGKLTALATLFLFFALGIAACVGEPAAKSHNDVIADGRRLYVSNCTACHGEQGDKVAEAPLNQKQFLDSRGDASLVHAIAEGKGVMPAWGKSRNGPLTYTEIESLVAYLDSAAGRTSPSLIANSGRNVYAQQCSRCHGENGDRVPVAPLAAKAFVDSFSDGQLFEAISDGRGLMPAFRTGTASPLSQDQVNAVIRYLRYSADVHVSEQSRAGRELFTSNCLNCHGERGDRVPNVALASAEELKKLGDGRITSIIAGGKGVMPAFADSKGGSFTVADIAAILTYLKSWSGLPAGAALTISEMPSEGKELYTKNCTGCHGDSGDKVAGVGLKSRAFLDSRKDEAMAREIGQGSAHGMPAWGLASGGPLAPHEIGNILGYLRSVAGSTPALVKTIAMSGQSEDAITRGKELYTLDCAACHGEGRAKVANANLADAAFLQRLGDDVLAQSITFGKGSMPSWGKERGGPLTETDVAALVAYLKSVSGKVDQQATGSPVTPVPNASVGSPASVGKKLSDEAATGQKLYTKNCQACHGEGRDKVASAKLADAASLVKQGDATLSDSIANGKGSMPSWSKQKGGVLDDRDIAAIIAYLKAVAVPQ